MLNATMTQRTLDLVDNFQLEIFKEFQLQLEMFPTRKFRVCFFSKKMCKKTN